MFLATNSKVAYFTMEVGINAKIPTYSGGLGILAGDTLKAAADMSFPMVGVTLLNKHGYFFQDIDDGKQIDVPVSWSINDFLEPLTQTVKVQINGDEVLVGAWLKTIEGINGMEIPILFLHTDLPQNTPEAKDITDHLYGKGHEYRLKQEIVLGVGGTKMLSELGFNQLEKYHMNEGHSALLVLELLRDIRNIETVKKHCVFTTHTPVPAGHDIFDMKMVSEFLCNDLQEVLPQKYKDRGQLNMTELAMDFSGFINAVAKKHTEVTKKMFPEYEINSITNGVHANTWISQHFQKCYEKNIPNFKQDPTQLNLINKTHRKEIWQAHYEGKKQIIDFANAYSNAGLDYDNFTIGWARRFTAYKRPEFLFKDINRLQKIADSKGPIQIIYAGKAHPSDMRGKELIYAINELSKKLTGNLKLVFLKNYDMYLAKFFTSGVDVWLNTPLPPREASGTSGMKCALNGIPQIGVLDGWWHEGYVENQTGWTFETEEDLYDLLEFDIIGTFYNNHEKWTEMMQKTIMLNGSKFNSNRMLQEYINLAYTKKHEN